MQENYSGVELTLGSILRSKEVTLNTNNENYDFLILASENFQRLVEIMPEVDPDYLEKVAAKLARSHRYNKVGLGNWIMENVGNPELPKKLDVETVAASVVRVLLTLTKEQTFLYREINKSFKMRMLSRVFVSAALMTECGLIPQSFVQVD